MTVAMPFLQKLITFLWPPDIGPRCAIVGRQPPRPRRYPFPRARDAAVIANVNAAPATVPQPAPATPMRGNGPNP